VLIPNGSRKRRPGPALIVIFILRLLSNLALCPPEDALGYTSTEGADRKSQWNFDRHSFSQMSSKKEELMKAILLRRLFFYK
jgi:hypothetical protein